MINLRPFYIVWLVLLSLDASAQISPAGPAVEVLPGQGFRVLQPASISAIPPVNRTVNFTPGAGLGVQDTLRAPNGLGGNFNVVSTRVASEAAIRAAAVKFILRGAGAAGVALTAWELWEANRMRVTPTGVERDVGTPGTMQEGVIQYSATGYQYDGVTTAMEPAWRNSGFAAAMAAPKPQPLSACQINGVTIGNPGQLQLVQAVGDPKTFYWRGPNYVRVDPPPFTSPACGVTNPNQVHQVVFLQDRQANAVVCPLGQDLTAPEPDSFGNCPTGNYAPADPSQVTSVVGTAPISPSIGQAVYNRAMDLGEPIASGPISITGPASVTGTPTVSTTTKANGDVVTKTTTPSVNLTYSGDTGLYGFRTTSLTRTDYANGSPSTTETEVKETDFSVTVPGSGSSTGGSGQVSGDIPVNCDKYPNSLGCLTPGQSTDIPPPIRETPVTFSPIHIPAPSGCPLPRTVNLSVSSITLSYDPLCDLAPSIRMVLLAMTWLGASIFIGRAVSS